MGYCLNPKCSHPENKSSGERCQSCGSQLVLRDRYRIIRALAQGGFGATFLAQDEGSPSNLKCVVKQLRLSTTAPEVFQMARQLFAREAKTLAKIGVHPQVPRLLDYFEDSKQFYLVQEYISGLTLQQEVKSAGPFSEEGVKQFLSEFLPLLQEVHDQKVIHRDIKPANLIRRSEDRKLVLIDFGAVKDQVTQTTNNQTDAHTAFTAFAVGTRGFAPPEQIALRPVYSSDIYALGVTCLYLLIGKSPQELDYNSSTGEIGWQDKVQISDYLKKVLGKMLEWSVRHRYKSANEVLKALQLEPYMDSLAKGMSNQAYNSPSPSGDDSHAASISQIAAGIRARRAKSGEVEQTANLGSQVLTPTTTPKPATKKPKITRRLDSNGLIKAYVDGRRSFPLHDLSLLDLQRVNLSAANFYSSKLDRTNFYKANLSNGDFGEASLKQANLKEANLSKADLSHADLEEADLRGADLSYATLNDANLRAANLCGANLINAKVSEEQLASAKTNIMTVRPSGKRGLF